MPKSAVERRKDSRLLMSTTTVKRLPPHVVSALANGLQVERENRITDLMSFVHSFPLLIQQRQFRTKFQEQQA